MRRRFCLKTLCAALARPAALLSREIDLVAFIRAAGTAQVYLPPGTYFLSGFVLYD